MGVFIDLTGQRFGRLTVIKRVENKQLKNGRQKVQWLCQCDCGNTKIVTSEQLKSGHTNSCGCICKEHPNRTTHGRCGTRLYQIWNSMKKRCMCVNDKSYKYYGDRGITVCDEWLHDFQAFYDWAMANGYKDSLTIDRIDVSGNYEPSNCRWVSRKVQMNNTRQNHHLTYNGKTQTIAQWADELNIKHATISIRLKRGKTIEEALRTS
nr:MAG TPA: PVL ORF-50-like family [Caudoviricetes sp.]